MTNHLQHKQPGDPLTFSATAHNAFIDAAKDFADRRLQHNEGEQEQALNASATYVHVQNDTLVAFEKYDAVVLNGPVIVPSDSDNAEETFQYRNTHSAIRPAFQNEVEYRHGQFAIMMEGVEPGFIGVAMISGIQAVRMQFPDDETYTSANIPYITTTKLEASSLGPVTVLWHDTLPIGDNERWATVMLDAPDYRPVAMKIKDLDDNDYLVCNTWDGVNLGAADIFVAKDYTLRHDHTLYAGLTEMVTLSTQSVIAKNGVDDDETWVVQPGYEVGGIIFAEQPRNGTGLFIGTFAVPYLHRDGREWAVQPA